MQRAAHLLQEMTTPRPRLLEQWRAARTELANAEAALVAFARSCAAQMQMIATARALFAARPFQQTEGR